MSLYKLFGTSATATDGIWIEYGANEEGKPISFRIKRASDTNISYSKALEKHTKPYRRQIKNETIDQQTLMLILHKVFAESVVIDWENVTDENGKPLPFSFQNCLKLFSDLPDLFEDIREQATKLANFRNEEITERTKN